MPLPTPLGRSYGVFQGNIPLLPGDFILESAQDNITANAGGGWQNAFQITGQTSRIAVVATAGDSIQLPISAPGLEMLVINHGANPMQVYGNFMAGDIIDDQLGTAGVSQMVNSMVIYSCATAGKWYSNGIATGFSTTLGLETYSYSTVAANVGGTQGTGTALTAMLNNITSAGASYSVTLPPSTPGLQITVHNISANTVLVFPSAGGTGSEKINAAAANASLSMLTNTSTVFTCSAAGQWYTIPRTPS